MKNNTNGFALISVISLVVLLALVAVALLTLSNVTMRTSSLDDAEAKENAKLALAEALGDLQKTMGPDARISANASVLDANSPQPNLLGVWHGHYEDNATNTGPNYDQIKGEPPADVDNTGFIQWLSSGNNTALNRPDTTVTDGVQLIGDETTDNENNHVFSEPVNVDNGGRYAWHVFDESQKANISVITTVPTNNNEEISAVNSSGQPGYQFSTNFASLDGIISDEADKLATLDTLELVDNTLSLNRTDAFFTLTEKSRSLLVNPASGGYQTDLSLLFGAGSLPNTFTPTYIYSNSMTPVATRPLRSATAMPIASPDPTWELLYSHYQMYNSPLLNGAGANVSLDTSDEELYIKDAGWDVINNPVKSPNARISEEQQIHPILSNAQFIISGISSEESLLAARDEDFVYVMIDMMFTFWNPYNVPLVMDGYEVDMYNFPLGMDIYHRDTTTNVETQLNKHPVLQSNFINDSTAVTNSTGQRTFYRARLKGPYTLQPGEFLTLMPDGTAIPGANRNNQNSVSTFIHQGRSIGEGNLYSTTLSREAGFGQARLLIDPSTGAISGEDLDGNSTGTVYNDPGNEILFSVFPMKFPLDTVNMPELNDTAIDFHLKIYKVKEDPDTGQLYTDDQITFDPTGKNSNIDDPIYGLDPLRIQVGSVELNLSSQAELENNLPSYGRSELPPFTMANPTGRLDTDTKSPFLVASLRLKTELDSSVTHNPANGSPWLHNGITNMYFTDGVPRDDDSTGQLTAQSNHQYELTWEPATSWSSAPMIEIPGYGATGVGIASGQRRAVFSQIPLTPATSLAQFSHAPLNVSGLAPRTTQIVGNSFAPRSITQDQKSIDHPAFSGSKMLDHSYMANNTLFDNYFLSSVTAEEGPLFSSGRDIDTIINDLTSGAQKMPNQNYSLAETVPLEFSINLTNYADFAQYLYNDGAFNVNSTSIEAWALFLSSGTQESLAVMDLIGGSLADTGTTNDDEAAFSRFTPLGGGKLTPSSRWNSHRRLTAEEITTLAENVVAEVRARGPFQSISEFVNRRLEAGVLGESGALQSAIEASNLNRDFGVPNGTGTDTSDGAPSQLTQADILNRLAPSLTVRGDTFKIRAYGESRNGSKAWCEALVQRQHDYVDATDLRTLPPADLNEVNTALGRKFKIISFKWLSEDEI